jgi:hypothetical protein
VQELIFNSGNPKFLFESVPAISKIELFSTERSRAGEVVVTQQWGSIGGHALDHGNAHSALACSQSLVVQEKVLTQSDNS